MGHEKAMKNNQKKINIQTPTMITGPARVLFEHD